MIQILSFIDCPMQMRIRTHAPALYGFSECQPGFNIIF
jgi:hypothetical protein